MTLKEKLQHRYALSEKGAQDMILSLIHILAAFSDEVVRVVMGIGTKIKG